MNELADVIEENQVKGVIADLMTVETVNVGHWGSRTTMQTGCGNMV